MIEIRSYQQGDAFKINIKKAAFVENDIVLMALEADVALTQINSRVITVTSDETPIAVIYYTLTEVGKVNLEAIIGEEVSSFGLEFAKKMKRWFVSESIKVGMPKIRTTLRSTYPEGRKWLSFLGMKKEETIKNYFENGVDCEIWSTVGV